jgi:trehalose synthase
MKTRNISLKSYENIAPKGIIDILYKLAEKVKDKSFLHINSTPLGGGVAEMLLCLIPLMKELGIKARWQQIEGSPLFFKTTKMFHNSLQGTREYITPEMFEEYKKINSENEKKLNLNADLVLIHDPQPAALVNARNEKSKWLWRCHIDISHPQRNVWQFLKNYVEKYDGAIFSMPGFAQKLPIPQILLYPSIDPLSDKNRELSKEEIDNVTGKFNIPADRPIIVQVSRFDKFKDPLGVIQAYKMVKKYNDCILILAGGGATDDPESKIILEKIMEVAKEDKDIYILNLPPDSNVEINALQRIATIVLQKSVKEGFGLTVAEAMWKGKPVIGGDVGGIRAQLYTEEVGYRVNSIEGCAYRLRYLLNNLHLCPILGKAAKEYVRNNFLITRHLRDYLSLLVMYSQ